MSLQVATSRESVPVSQSCFPLMWQLENRMCRSLLEMQGLSGHPWKATRSRREAYADSVNPRGFCRAIYHSVSLCCWPGPGSLPIRAQPSGKVRMGPEQGWRVWPQHWCGELGAPRNGGRPFPQCRLAAQLLPHWPALLQCLHLFSEAQMSTPRDRPFPPSILALLS